MNIMTNNEIFTLASHSADYDIVTVPEGVSLPTNNTFTVTTTSTTKFRKYPSKWIYVTFQKEGIHCWPDAKDMPGVEFLANPHRHMFKFRVEIQVFHDDREIEFILFKRELEKRYDEGTLQLDYKSCEMICDDLANTINNKYPNRNIELTVSEDGENGATIKYEVQ